MVVEFVRLSHPEKIYGERKLLESQISLLTVSKQLKEFDNLRKEEVALKIAVKRMLDELKEALAILDSSLPKTEFYEKKLKQEKAHHDMVKLILKQEKQPEEKRVVMHIAKPIKIVKEIKEETSQKPAKSQKTFKQTLEDEISEIRKRISHLR